MVVLTIAILCPANTLQADFVNVPFSSFHQGDAGFRHYTLASGYVFSPNNSVTLFAPVHLPDGVVIKNIRLSYLDNDGAFNIELSLKRMNMFSGELNTMFSTSSSGASGSMRTVVDSSCSPAASYRKVYNNACQYFLQVSLRTPSTQQIYAVTIEYQQ